MAIAPSTSRADLVDQRSKTIKKDRLKRDGHPHRSEVAVLRAPARPYATGPAPRHHEEPCTARARISRQACGRLGRDDDLLAYRAWREYQIHRVVGKV